MKTIEMLGWKKKIKKLYQLNTLASNADIVYLNGLYYFTNKDKLITLSEDFSTESITTANPTQQAANGAWKSIEKYNNDIILTTLRKDIFGEWIGVKVYTYNAGVWTERYNYWGTTNAVNDMHSNANLYVKTSEGINVFDVSYNRTGMPGVGSRVCELNGVIYTARTPYAKIDGIWTLLDETNVFMDVFTDGEGVFYVGDAGIYAVSGSTLEKLNNGAARLRSGSETYLYGFYSPTKNKYYIADMDNVVWEIDAKSGFRYVYRFPVSYNCRFCENSEGKVIMHARNATNSILYEIL